MESITESKLETGSSSMYAEELTSSSSSELLSRFLHGANTNGLVKTHVFDEISVIKEEEVEKTDFAFNFVKRFEKTGSTNSDLPPPEIK